MRFVKRFLVIVAVIAALACFTGCGSKAETKKEPAQNYLEEKDGDGSVNADNEDQETGTEHDIVAPTKKVLARRYLEEKYGKAFVIAEKENQETEEGHYMAHTDPMSDPEFSFHVNVDNDGKTFSDNYVSRLVCAGITERIYENLYNMYGYNQVFVESAEDGYDLDRTDMSISEFVKQYPENRFTICVFHFPDRNGIRPGALYWGLSRLFTGLEELPQGTVQLYLITGGQLESARDFCAFSDHLTDGNAHMGTLISIPFSKGVLEMGWEEFEDQCKGEDAVP